MGKEPREEGLRRILGPIDATCIVVGAIVGVGIFFTPSRVAALTGSGSIALLTWAIAGGIALLGALTFAELGGMHTRSGGQYTILRDTYGPFPSFLYVVCNATAVQTGAIAIIAIICVENLAVLGGSAGLDWLTTAHCSALLILGLMGANIIGVRAGSTIQNITVYTKIATLLAVTILALYATPSPPGAEVATDPATEGGFGILGLIFAGLVPCLFSFGGWQHALWIGGEIREPQKNVPRAIVGGVLVVILVYLLANWAYLDLLGYRGVRESKALAADAVATIFPDLGKRIIAGAVAFSAFGVLNAQFLSGPRLVFAMARDGRFFRPFSRANERFKTPVAAILLMGLVALALLYAAGKEGVDKLLTGVVFIDTFFFALTGFALILLRRRDPSRDRPVRVPGYPLVPLLFVLGEIGILIGAYLDAGARIAALLGAGWIIAAALCYLLFFRQPITRPRSIEDR